MLKLALMANGGLLVITGIISFLAASGFDFLHWDQLTSFANVLGIVLLVAAVVPFYLAFRPHRLLIGLVIALNIVGALGSVGVVLFANLQTSGNVWLVLLTGLTLLLLAIFEFLGLRRISAETP